MPSPPPFYAPVGPSPAVSAVLKWLDLPRVRRAPNPHDANLHPFRFRSDHPGHHAFALKSRACPHCGRIGTLNRHSRLTGNDTARPAACRLRGQRVYCSARGARGGCGRTFSIYLADVLPRHSVTGALFSALLVAVLAGASLHSAAQAALAPFATPTAYRLASRLRHQAARVRALLSGASPPPSCAHRDPLHQTLAHLRAVFADAADLVAAFQLRFQVPLIL